MTTYFPSTGERLAAPVPRPNTMRQVVILSIMGAEEAREIINKINSKAAEMGRLLLDLKEREGWRALGYASWTQCLRCEFEYSRKHLYELMNAAPVIEKLLPKGYNLNTAQADALADFPAELHEPIVEATISRYGDLSENKIRRVGGVFTQAVKTGYVNTGDGEISTPIDAALTREDEEAMLKQKQHIADNGKKREYLIRHEQVKTDARGRLLLADLPAGARVFVSVWIEADERA